MNVPEKKAPVSLFISYAHSDGSDVARRLAADLQAGGYDIWWDQERLKPSASWTNGIEVGIDRAEVVLALLSQGSYGSDICRAEQLRALRKHKRVLPILLRQDVDVPIHLETEQYLKFYGLEYDQNLLELKKAIANNAITASLQAKYKKRYRTFPPLPQYFVARPQLLHSLRKEIIREGDERCVAVTAIRGMGGIGKSVLAQAICHDEAVQDAFPDGVMWVTVGELPTNDHLREQIRELAKALGDSLEPYDTLLGCQNQLRNTLSDKSVLIVLDDVWDPRHVQYFNADAPRCRLLITTRNQEVVRGTDAREFTVKVMEEGESRELLARKSGLKVQDLPPEAASIIQQCGALPLGLAMLGARAGKGKTEWARIVRALEEGRAQRVSLKLSDYRHENLYDAFQVSVNSLRPENKERYIDLAVFPKDTPVPESVLQAFWGMNEDDTTDVTQNWSEASLAVSDDQGRIMLHDLQLDYVRSQVVDLKQLHIRLLEALEPTHHHDSRHRRQESAESMRQCEGYYLTWSPYHLREAGKTEELRRLLLSPQWIRTKLRKRNITALLADYELLPSDPDLRLILQALQLSAHVLARDPNQLASQILGRLRFVKSGAIQDLLRDLRVTETQSWVEPLWSSLWEPGAVLLFTMANHSLRVNTVAITEDGRRAVSASDDSTLKVSDLESGGELRTLAGHASSVTAVAISRDGCRVLSASNDNTLKLWDLESGTEIRTLTGHTHLVNGVALSGDGRRAVSSSYDKTVRVWDLDTGAELHTLVGHSLWVNAVAFTGDGRRIVSASLDKTLKVWDAESGAQLSTLTGHQGSVDHVIVSPDGRRAISASYDRTLKTWDIESGNHLRTLTGHSSWITAVVATKDGRRLVSASHDSTVKVWDLEGGMECCTLSGHSAQTNAVAVTPDGKKVVSASDDNTLKVWDLESGAEIRTLFGHSGPVNAVAITPDGKRAVSANGTRKVSASHDNTLKVWDLESGTEVRILGGHSGPVNAVVITPDGSRAVSVSYDKTTKVWDLHRRVEIYTLLGHSGSVTSVAVTSDGRLAISASVDKTLKVWNLDNGSEVFTLEGHSDWVSAVSISSDGKRAISASHDKTLKVWNLESGSLIHTLAGHSGPLNAVVLTPDGRRAISASSDKTLKIWDIESGAGIHTLTGHLAWVNAVDVTRDGRQALSASYDNTLKLWDISSGACLRTFSGHSRSVDRVVIAVDGKQAISASGDNTLKLWDLESGSTIRTLVGHSAALNAVALTHQKRRVVSGSYDNTVRIWNCDGRELATFSADSSIWSCAVSTDEDTILAGGYLGEVHLLQLHELAA